MLEISPQLVKEAKISVKDMATYLIQHGWHKIPNQNPKVMIFQGINDDFGNPIVLTLPSNDVFLDAIIRLSEAVNLVAFLESRSPESVLIDLREVGRLGLANDLA